VEIIQGKLGPWKERWTNWIFSHEGDTAAAKDPAVLGKKQPLFLSPSIIVSHRPQLCGSQKEGKPSNMLLHKRNRSLKVGSRAESKVARILTQPWN
jgi:hypothetical protein